jgi:outer membrane protein with beta-barrel domain
MKRFALMAGLGLGAALLTNAQEVSHFAFSLGAGFTEPVGHTGRLLDTGWNLQAGAGANFNPYVGVLIDLGYSSFGINSTTLNNLGYPDGGLKVFSATLDPIVHLTPRGHADIYITGGGGIYHRYQEFSQPSAVEVQGYNPFFGFYNTLLPANQILASYSTNKPGVDIGAGIAFGSKWHGKFFAEARYNRIFMNNDQHTDYVPVIFGFRW